MMLYGLAAENLIKGVIVAKNPFLASKGNLPNWFTKHNLASLAVRAGLPVLSPQQHLLKRLQNYVESGKYPVARQEGQGGSTWVSFGAVDSNDILRLLEYLEEELRGASGGFVVPHPRLAAIHRQR